MPPLRKKQLTNIYICPYLHSYASCTMKNEKKDANHKPQNLHTKRKTKTHYLYSLAHKLVQFSHHLFLRTIYFVSPTLFPLASSWQHHCQISSHILSTIKNNNYNYSIFKKNSHNIGLPLLMSFMNAKTKPSKITISIKLCRKPKTLKCSEISWTVFWVHTNISPENYWF